MAADGFADEGGGLEEVIGRNVPLVLPTRLAAQPVHGATSVAVVPLLFAGRKGEGRGVGERPFFGWKDGKQRAELWEGARRQRQGAMTRMAEWGPAGWTFLHCVGFAYPERATVEERQRMYAFLASVGSVLPCRRCRSHCDAYVRSHVRGTSAPCLAGREEVSMFLVEMHNDVNARLGKPRLPYEEVKAMYYQSSGASWVDGGIAASVAALVVVVVIYLLSRRVPSRSVK